MGNYLQSLRADPAVAPHEDERNHPLYYDWSLPKWSPFRCEQPSQAQGSNQAAAIAESSAVKQTRQEADHNRNINSNHDRNNGNKTQQQQRQAEKSAGKAAQGPKSASGGGLTSTVKSAYKTAKVAAKEAIHKSLKSKLTATVDRADTKPINADKAHLLPAHSQVKKEATPGVATKPKTSGANSSAGNNKADGAMKRTSDGTGSGGGSIKRVDSMRPQTIDQQKYGGIDDQAALKAATNIHTIGQAEKPSASSSSST